MQPLQDLLHRIRWDPEFGKGRFVLGYHDRIADGQQIVPFESVVFEADRPGFFSITGAPRGGS